MARCWLIGCDLCLPRSERDDGRRKGVRGEITFVGFGQSSTLLMEAHTRRKKKGGETTSMYLFMVSLLDIVSCLEVRLVYDGVLLPHPGGRCFRKSHLGEVQGTL